MLNEVSLIGYLGREPELITHEEKKPFCRIALATNSVRTVDGKKHVDTEWHNLICFGSTAELCKKYLKKGSLIWVRGSIRNRRWEDEAGVLHHANNITVQRLKFLDRANGVDKETEGEHDNQLNLKDENLQYADFDPTLFEFRPSASED